MSTLRKLFRPAEKHEDGRYKSYDDMSEEGKEATRLRMKFLGVMFVIVVLCFLIVREIEKLVEQGQM